MLLVQMNRNTALRASQAERDRLQAELVLYGMHATTLSFVRATRIGGVCCVYVCVWGGGGIKQTDSTTALQESHATVDELRAELVRTTRRRVYSHDVCVDSNPNPVCVDAVAAGGCEQAGRELALREARGAADSLRRQLVCETALIAW
jgi:hypothetical protein